MLGRIHIPRHVFRRTSSGAPGTLIAVCTPSRRGSASLTCTAPVPGPTSRPGLPASTGVGAVLPRAISCASCRRVRSWLSWSASGVSGPPPDPRSTISRNRWPVSFSASTAPGIPQNLGRRLPGASPPGIIQHGQWFCYRRLQHFQQRHRPGQCRILHGLAEGFLINATNCLARSADRSISAAVSWTASAAAFRSARSWSLPSSSAISFLLPASARRPTSQAPRSSAPNTTLAVSG
jgi:hypothetical protein